MTSKTIVFFAGIVFALGLTSTATAQGTPESLDGALREEIVLIKNSSLIPVSLQTTVFRPAGDGPFPLLLINHGKNPGPPGLQDRARHIWIAREFVRRGYAVASPMRQGFAKSGGIYVDGGCYTAGNGRGQGDDIRAVIEHFKAQPWIKADQIIVAGQSHGGLSSMAYAEKPNVGVKGIINFAGGLRFNDGQCAPQWKQNLVKAFGEYGANTQLPSLWFYGANDSFFDPELVKDMFEAYKVNNSNVTLVNFGPMPYDAHGLIGQSTGRFIWVPAVDKFLASIGMPFAAIEKTAVNDETSVPHLNERGKQGYKTFLMHGLPRAFALSATGAWGAAYYGNDTQSLAMANCNKANPSSPCKLYAVDDAVVWRNESTKE
jgi:dienelactone hydrolase